MSEVGAQLQSIAVPLATDGEVCFFVPASEPRCSATVKLQSSMGGYEARVDAFGAPLVVDVPYHLLPGSFVWLFAWSAATVVVEGSAQLIANVFVPATRSIIRPLVEYHCLLQLLRTEAEASTSSGPITLVCGSNSSGKNHIARTLCSYAARSGWKPMLVDLDCSAQQMIGIPGTIGAAVVEFPITIDEVLSLSLISVTYFSGSLDSQRHTNEGFSMNSVYVNYCEQLLNTMTERFSKHADDIYSSSGSIIVLPELKDNSGVNFVMDIAQRYNATNIICVGDNFMFHKLSHRCSQLDGASRKVSVDRISQSHSFAMVSSPESCVSQKISEYFYGSGAVQLHPSQWAKPFSSLTILVPKDENGQAALSNVAADEREGIIGCIGALYATTHGNSALKSCPLAYVRIQSMDPSGVVFLTTTHHTFPSEKLTLVVGSVRWITS